jgi:histidyl-tRNA synthetase
MADKPKKPQKLRARLPRGLGDRGPAEIAATRRMTETIREVYERYGFEPVETPAMEFTDALGKFLPDQDRPNEGVFSFQDDDEQWISLRYDLTAPLARYVAENFDSLPKPYRSYRAGYVYRNEKPGPGRFRQFMQFDADTVGSASPAADAEMCMMAADAMEALGIERGQYIVRVNSRKVLDGVMESIGITDETQKLTVLRAIDKLDKFRIEEIRKLLGYGRWDGGAEGKGDFTKGAGLQSDQIERVLLYATSSEDLTLARLDGISDEERVRLANPKLGEFVKRENGEICYKSNLSALKSLHVNFGNNSLSQSGIDDLQSLINAAIPAGYGYDQIRIDPSVVRGLEYYTGAVFEVELLLDTKDEKNRPVRFGSVGGGGRYDGLVSRFRGEPVPATGFSIGVSRLQSALTLIGKLEKEPDEGPVVVTVLDADRIGDYQKIVADLRNAGIRAELYLGSGKFGAQMKYADKRNSPCVIIQGSEEKSRGEVLIKDCFQGAMNAAITDREEYLAEQAKVQFPVPEDEVIKAVQAVLKRHGVTWGR